MAKKGENIYKRKDGRWEGRYCKPPEEGSPADRRVFGYVYGHSYHEVKQALVNARTGTKPPAAQKKAATLEQCAALWLEDKRQRDNLKAATLSSYERLLRVHIIPTLGKSKMDALGENTLRFFIRSKQRNGRVDGKGGLSAKTLQMLTTLLHAVQEYAVREGLASAAALLPREKTARKREKQPHVLTPAEQNRLESAIARSDNPNDLGILLCLYTGLRVGELCALQWNDVDFFTKTITVSRTLQRVSTPQGPNKTELVIDTPKTRNSARMIPISRLIRQKLLAFQAHKGYTERGAADFVFTVKNHPVEPRLFQKYFKRLLREAGVSDMNFHALRHTFATRCLESHMDIRTLSELLGHSTVNLSLQLYAHSLLEQKRIAIENLDQYMSRMENGYCENEI